MNYDDKLFRAQHPVVQSFVQHLAYYRAGKAIYDRLALKSTFWTATVDAHLMVASLQWCKVFGSHGFTNQTHWTKTPTMDAHQAKDDFRAQALAAASLTGEQWDDYWDEMCTFRGGYVAHCDIGFAGGIPNFETALAIAYAYDAWVRELIKPDILDDLWLKEYYGIWLKTASPIFDAAMKATRGMKE
jgi:hypothetical protein